MAQCVEIRMQVFVKEQQVPIAEEIDGKDDSNEWLTISNYNDDDVLIIVLFLVGFLIF